MRVAIAIGLLASCAGVGCLSSLQDGTGVQASQGQGGCLGAGCHHGSGSGGGSGSGSRTTAATGSGGTSSSPGAGTTSGTGSSSGSAGTSAASSSSGGNADAGVDCPDLYLTSRVYDDALGSPVAGATIEAVGLNGIPIDGAATSSQSDGTFTLCVPASVAFSMQVTAPGYPETVLEDLLLTKSEKLYFTEGGMALLSSQDVSAFGELVGYDSTKGVMLVNVSSLTGMGPCATVSGWQITLSFPDGGTLPDGGGLPYSRSYLDAVSYVPDPTLNWTSSVGQAVFFDLDPNVANRVAIEAVDANPDGGACQAVTGAYGLQGTALVGAQLLTYSPVLIP